MMFKIHVLKLLIMIVKMLMDSKCQATGSNYEFQSENAYLRDIQKEVKELEHGILINRDDQG